MWNIVLVGLSLMPSEMAHPSFAALPSRSSVVPVEGANVERSPFPPVSLVSPTPLVSRAARPCPDTLDALIPSLLRDLPSYANRVIQRSRDRNREVDISPSYVLLAGQADQEPLPLGSGDYSPVAPSENIQQVFFTTLERRYGASGFVQLQGYYWMILVRSPDAWQVVNLRSSLGDYPSRRPPSPPRDSNNGVVAQAVQLWLRDCRAGALRYDLPPQPPEP